MLLEEVNKLINGYEKEVDFTKIDEGTYIVGFDREGNIFEVEKTDNVDLTEYELEFEYGDVDYWVRSDIGVLIIRDL